jgi:[ribosomal protein S18]-alanine N-acetyltransferase
MKLLSSSQTSIRPMEIADLDQVFAIDQVSFKLPWPLRAFQYEISENPFSKCWVAETTLPDQSPRIVGMTVIWMIVDETHIATIAVHPEYRRQGIGALLLETILKESVIQGMHQVTLEVREGNSTARNLYQSYGFEIVGKRPRYYKDNNEDALIMTLLNLNQNPTVRNLIFTDKNVR